MKKDYQAPEVEIISLIAEEPTTSKSMLEEIASGRIEASMGVEDSIFG